MAFIIRNFCISLSSALTTSYSKLSSQECSEIIGMLYDANPSSTAYVDILDPNSSTPFRVYANREFTFRGLTDSGLLSAKSNGSLTFFYRTQFFGSMTDL